MGANLPKGWPAALFIRRARRSRAQEAAALGTIHFQLSTFNYSLAKLYLAFVSVARFGGGRGIRRLAARGWASLLIGADLPKGRALARSLFTRRARRSRAQEAAALGTIHFQLSTFNYSLAKLYLAFVSVARFGGGRGIRRLAARGWASLLIGADLPKGRALARSLFTRRARRSRPQDAAALGTINYQFTTINHQLSTIHFQLFICHALPCFIAIARFGGGNDLFASMMACGAFYTATETVALPGHRATVSCRGGCRRRCR